MGSYLVDVSVGSLAVPDSLLAADGSDGVHQRGVSHDGET